MVANRHNVRNKLNFPFPSANGTLPMLSGGSSLGSSTFISSSSCTGGRPERRQILEKSELLFIKGMTDSRLTLYQACRRSRTLSSAAPPQLGSDQTQNPVYGDRCCETNESLQRPRKMMAGGSVFLEGKETVFILEYPNKEQWRYVQRNLTIPSSA